MSWIKKAAWNLVKDDVDKLIKQYIIIEANKTKSEGINIGDYNIEQVDGKLYIRNTK